MTRAARVTMGAAVGLYLVSFLLPLNDLVGWYGWFGGWWAFQWYATAPFDPTATPKDHLVSIGWLANPAFWAGVVAWRLRRPAGTFAAGLLAAVFAASVQLVHYSMPLAYPCYIAWMASCVLLTVAGWLARPQPEGDL